VSLGTSGVLFAASDAYRPDAASAVHTFCHALPGTWHQMGVILAAADALNWWSRIAGAGASDLTGPGRAPAPGRTLFLPYLGGERTPHNDAGVRALVPHLDHASDRAGLTRAVLEGVTHAFRDSFDALRARAPRSPASSRWAAVALDYWVRPSPPRSAARRNAGLGRLRRAFGAARLG
jgi:xylulokinase